MFTFIFECITFTGERKRSALMHVPLEEGFEFLTQLSKTVNKIVSVKLVEGERAPISLPADVFDGQSFKEPIRSLEGEWEEIIQALDQNEYWRIQRNKLLEKHIREVRNFLLDHARTLDQITQAHQQQQSILLLKGIDASRLERLTNQQNHRLRKLDETYLAAYAALYFKHEAEIKDIDKRVERQRDGYAR